MATAQISPEQAAEVLTWYGDGHQVEFVQDVLGRKPWSMQREIIRDVFLHKVVAVASCNAAGKSDVASDVALTFLATKPGSIVITTAPTWRQVKDVLWRYIRDKYAKAPVKLSDKQCNQVGLDLAEDWFAVGLSTKDAEKFFGYHADDILVIVDEASGVEEEIYIGVDAVTPNLNAHVLMIGNPTNPDGRFYKSFQDPLVKTHTISAFDTPNLMANDIRDIEQLLALFTPPEGRDPLAHLAEIEKRLIMPYPALISPGTVYRRYLQWGPESPMWQSLILGQFPSQAEHALIPLNLIMKSMEVRKQIDDPNYTDAVEWNIQREVLPEYGLDVARFGSDRTVLTARYGDYVDDLIGWAKLDTVESGKRVLQLTDPFEYWSIKVDDTGVGGGVTDFLVHAANDNPLYHYRTVPVNFGQATTEPIKYFNFRAEMFWNLAERFKQHKIALPNDLELANELASIRYEFTSNKQIKIEDKDKTKKRTGHSPDRADSLALAFTKSGTGKYTLDEDQQRKADNTIQDNTIIPMTAGLGKW